MMIFRRHFLGCLAASSAKVIFDTRSAASDGKGASTLVAPIVDVSEDTRPAIRALRELGVRTVFRYYSYYQASLPSKRLQRAECDALLDAGLSVAVVWQYFSQQIQGFGSNEAKRIADSCLLQAESVSQRPGSAIYFGVDGDLGLNNSDAQILISFFEYMRGRLEGAKVKVGVYGSGHVCRMLRQRGLADYYWLPKSPGWAGTREYYADGLWSLYQNIHEYPLGKTGVKVDFNVLNPKVSDFGQWNKNGVGKGHPQTESQMIFESFRFPTSNPLVFRSEPTLDSREIFRLHNARTRSVKILRKTENWVKIYFGDEDTSGQSRFITATGWCRESDLSQNYLKMTY